MIKLSIIIVAYKSDSVIFECIKSIIEYNDLKKEEIEIIIVDNYIHSIIQDKILLLNTNGIKIKYIKNKKNGGFGQGNNIGVAESNGEIFLFLNPDTLLIDNIFTEIVSIIEGNNNYIVGFTLRDNYGKLNNSYSIFPEKFHLMFVFFLIKKYLFYSPNQIAYLNKLIWPWGAALAIHKGPFLKAGMFDENIFLCNEEPDLLRRIPNRKIYISQKSIVHTEGHGNGGTLYRHQEYLKSLKYYFEKYKLHFRLYYIFIKCSTYLKIILKINYKDNKNLLKAMNYKIS
ncbi:MAG TPA: glycosyltransferase [Bacteroidales bacterium]|nr:glycosyltransferase [Bacteroidales bacterium]